MSNKFSSSSLSLAFFLSFSHTQLLLFPRFDSEAKFKHFHLFSLRKHFLLRSLAFQKKEKRELLAILFLSIFRCVNKAFSVERRELTSKLHLRGRRKAPIDVKREREWNFSIEKSLIHYLITSFNFQSSLADSQLFVHLASDCLHRALLITVCFPFVVPTLVSDSKNRVRLEREGMFTTFGFRF